MSAFFKSTPTPFSTLWGLFKKSEGMHCWWKCEMVQLWKTGWQLYKKKTLLKQNYHMILQCSWGYYPQEN